MGTQDQILSELRPPDEEREVTQMTEKAMMVGMIVFYVVLIFICVWMIYRIYNAVLDLIRELLIGDDKEGKYEETEENGGSGTLTRGTVLSGSNGRDAKKEESGKWQKKKS